MPVELQVVFFMVQSLKMPPLMSTYPLKSLSNWTFELLKRVFEPFTWHLSLLSLCVRFPVIYCNFRSFFNAASNFAEKGFTNFATTICRFARCMRPKINLFFIHHFLPRLSAFGDSYYSRWGPHGITPGRFYQRNAKFWAENLGTVNT